MLFFFSKWIFKNYFVEIQLNLHLLAFTGNHFYLNLTFKKKFISYFGNTEYKLENAADYYVFDILLFQCNCKNIYVSYIFDNTGKFIRLKINK